ncbi:MAG TPA: YgiQ family radical SAM protein [Candidatus Tidjanibacter gallistercoris]|nr:YgiQ family radical SAM protein [Candidatus Tidjanibacter gallistercoris]
MARNHTTHSPAEWLPTSAREVEALGWDCLDVILFSGDAYIDHPAFGAAVIGRLLLAEGYRVAIVPQPNWRDDLRDFRKLGKPRLFFGVSAGSMDSMVNHYTANLRLRSDDAYTPGGRAGFRPDRAVTVYTRILKALWPNTPVVIGGIEASLRRLTHYDYWSDSLKPSVLIDSGADLLMYGMGDKSIIDVARALRNGFNAKLLRRLPQVAFIADDAYVARLDAQTTFRLHSFEECVADKRAFGENFVRIETESNRLRQEHVLLEKTGDRWVVVNPPYPTLTEAELDRSFDLPYTRLPHPRYDGKGDIPAYEMIKHSVNIHRGCFGGCSFCTISAHQGKFISSRSERSILAEVEKVVGMESFRGYLSDIGGPSANMYGMGGRDTSLCSRCTRPSCLHPKPCPNLDNSHARLLELYRKVSAVKGVRKAFIGSGIRYDLFDRSDGGAYLREVVVNHTSGRLKVAPEHTEEAVLRLMRKPSFALFRELNEQFNDICRREGLRYQLIPYFISSHPGCTEADMERLSEITRSLHFRLEQVQDLTPTPMTLSSVMFYTETDPYTGRPLYVAKNQDEKRRQKSYFFRNADGSLRGERTAPRSGKETYRPPKGRTHGNASERPRQPDAPHAPKQPRNRDTAQAVRRAFEHAGTAAGKEPAAAGRSRNPAAPRSAGAKKPGRRR